MLAPAAPALADAGPHVEGAGAITDSCAGCHRTHTADAPHLLKEEQTSLCFTCHGATGSGSNLDVVTGVGYSTGEREGEVGALRGGGFTYALIDSDAASGYRETGSVPTLPVSEKEAVTSTHSISEAEVTAWGFGEISGEVDYGKTIKLSCGNCHDPHGSGNYRILRTTPEELWSYYETHYEGVEPDEVSIADPVEKNYTVTDYWQGAENTNAAEFNEKIAAWCSTCHTRYSADHAGSTDSGDAVYTYRHTSNKTGGGSVWRNCAQCHVAHGSNASMSSKAEEVPFPDPAYEPPAGDSRLLRADNRGVCQICHAK